MLWVGLNLHMASDSCATCVRPVVSSPKGNPCRAGSKDLCVLWRAKAAVSAGEEVCNGYHEYMLQDRSLIQYGFLQVSGRQSWSTPGSEDCLLALTQPAHSTLCCYSSQGMQMGLQNVVKSAGRYS
jgi:hypothetical protein